MNQATRETMYLTVSEEQLPFFQALSSRTRLQILQLLQSEDRSIKDISSMLGISSAIVTKHVQMLEETGIIRTYVRPGKRGLRKLCSLQLQKAFLEFGKQDSRSTRSCTEIEIPISAYDRWKIEVPCGLATGDRVFGRLDDPSYFGAPNRYSACLLWFGCGFVEYPIPLRDVALAPLEEIEISLEIGSSCPVSCQPLEAAFVLNGIRLGTVVLKGANPACQGRYTPEWWSLDARAGRRVILRINKEGTFLIGRSESEERLEKISSAGLDAVLDRRALADQESQAVMRLGIETCKEDEQCCLMLYGRSFGDFDQNILVRCYYGSSGCPDGKASETINI